MLVLPIAAFGSAALADRASRLIGTVVIALGYAAVVLTGSRAAILAATVGAAVAVLGPARPARRWRAVLVTTALAATLGGLAVASGGSTGIRGDVWAAAWRAVLAHPFGVGIGRAGAVISAGVSDGENIQHAHDLWLNWAVEAGLPGLAAIVGVTGAAVVVCVRAARHGSGAALMITAGLAGFATVSLVDDPANSLRVALAFWAVLGLLAAEDPRLTPPRQNVDLPSTAPHSPRFLPTTRIQRGRMPRPLDP